MNDVPDNVDLQWIARTLVAIRDEQGAMRAELRALKQDVRSIREDLDVLTMRVIRIDGQLQALRDDVQRLFEMHGDLRRRVEAIEQK